MINSKIYGKVIVSTGETLIEYFNRSILDSLNQYKILGKPTVFDLGDARIISLDLNEVAKSGNFQAQTQTAVMYMIAYFISKKNSKTFTTSSLRDNNVVSEPYIEYYKNKAKEIENVSRRIVFDEIHRVSNFPTVIKQITEELKESRKNNTEVVIATQSYNVPLSIAPLCNNLFLMDTQNN